MCCFAWLAALALLLGLGLLMLEERVVMCCFPWLGAGNGGHECLLELQESLSTPRLLAAVLGTFLFWNAGVLSESTPFRWAASSRLCGESTWTPPAAPWPGRLCSVRCLPAMQTPTSSHPFAIVAPHLHLCMCVVPAG
jgi:hypothetical protein